MRSRNSDGTHPRHPSKCAGKSSRWTSSFLRKESLTRQSTSRSSALMLLDCPHFRYLLEEPTHSVLFGRDRIVPVLVPHAGRFCIQKLAVYELRSDAAKREKDIAQSALLAAALAE